MSLCSCGMVQEGWPIAQQTMGMWVVKPEEDCHRKRLTTIVHLDTILRGAHLIPVYGSHFIPPHFCHSWSLDAFKAFL